MSFDHFLHWLDATQFSAVMRESVWAEPIVETIHVLTLTLFLGFVLLLDLRLLDVVLRRKRVSEMFEQFNPWLFRGFAVMLVTGLLLFSADPVNFYSTLFFKLKMVMLVLAGVNVAFYHATIGKHIAEWDVARGDALEGQALRRRVPGAVGRDRRVRARHRVRAAATMTAERRAAQ